MRSQRFVTETEIQVLEKGPDFASVQRFNKRSSDKR